jgi:raffinose/stachyose/melibiose transport system substrate-binding protein
MQKQMRWALICMMAALLLLHGGCVPVTVNTTLVTTDTQITEAEPVELTLWHIWATESDSNKEPFEKALTEWMADNPQIKIMTEATENETYKVKLRVAIAVNEAPDIFYSWGAGFAKPFIDAGKVLPLDGRLTDEMRNKLQAGSLDNFTYDGQVYALPTFMIAGIFYVNTELFDRYQIAIPKTFDELMLAIQGFRKAGLTPIALGAKDGWPAMFYQNVLAIRTAGIGKCLAALKKEASFDQPAFVESADLLKQLVDAGAFDARSIQMTQYEADQQFLSGRVPMYYTGSWLAGILEKNDQMRHKVQVYNFPAVPGATGDANGFIGGTIDTFMISAFTRYPDEAVKAMSEINERFSLESFLAGAGLPAWQFDVDKTLASPLSIDIVELLEGRDGFVLAWDTLLEGLDARTHINLVTDIIAGRLTPEEFASEMQKLNE